MKKLQNFTFQNGPDHPKQPILSNKCRHLKRVFKDHDSPQSHNLILLLEEDDVEIGHFKTLVDEEFLQQYTSQNSEEENSLMVLKSVSLPVEIPAGRVKEVESLKNWGYNFKVDTFGNYKENNISITDVPVEFTTFMNDAEFCSRYSKCIIYDPNQSKILVNFQKQLGELQETSILHSVIEALELFGNEMNSPTKEEESMLKKRNPKVDGYYVCNNLWVFLSHPPCVMCAMALTHSRISRLYYAEGGQVCGVKGLVGGNQERNPLATKHSDKTPQIFCDQRLNHNYKVFIISN